MKSSVFINSAVSVAAAYLIMHFLNEFATASVAAYFGLKPVMYLHSIKYNAYDKWTPYIVNRTFMASGAANLLLGFIFFRLFLAVKKQNKWFRIFFLWCAVIGFVMFMGKIFSIPFYEAKPDPPGHIAFGVVVAYHYVGDSIKWMISIFAFLVTLVSGLFFAYQFLRNAETKEQLKKGIYRRSFITNNILVPYLLGMTVAAAVNFPNNVSSLLVYFMAGLILILASLAFAGRTRKVLLYREEPQQLSRIAIGLLLALVVFYRFFYSKGIGCKGYFDFILCCNCS